MNLSNWKGEHYLLAVASAALAGVASWQASSGHALVVGGVSVLAVLTTIKALLTEAPKTP
jgi:4-amino-4-deoxy-L-arabinose transferase-like glycosyltransferase